MTQRFPIVISFLTLAATVGGVLVLRDSLNSVSKRVAALERRLESREPAPPPPPPAAKEEAPIDPAKRREMERKVVREIADKENQAHFDILAKKLGLEPGQESKLREAFIEEFSFYTDGVVRTFDSLQFDDPKPGGNWMATPEFRKGLEERVAATDKKVRDLLTAGQALIFEQWREEIRKDRYELD